MSVFYLLFTMSEISPPKGGDFVSGW